MTTLTIKINEHSEKGKAFLEFAKTFFKDEKDVEIIVSDSKKTNKKDILDSVEEEQSPYNPEFVSEILERSKNIKNQELSRLNPKDIWGSIL